MNETRDADTCTQALGELWRRAEHIIVGQRELLKLSCLAVLAGGHVLLEGVPGLAKTLTVKVFARLLGLEFQRVQGTPDLLPGDILGGYVLEGDGQFRFRPGPIFTDLLLVDEINRMPPRTQAALLEAMEERQVTLDRKTLPLPPNFTVFATQNPIEFEGTYPLPEAQLDRFLLKIPVLYPSLDAEMAILAQKPRRDGAELGLDPLPEDWLSRSRAGWQAVRAEAPILTYVAALVRQTRDWPSLLLGASPRAGVGLLQMARALAAAEGRDYTLPDDVKDAAPAVLRHRLRLRPEAELEGENADSIIAAILSTVPIPRLEAAGA